MSWGEHKNNFAPRPDLGLESKPSPSALPREVVDETKGNGNTNTPFSFAHARGKLSQPGSNDPLQSNKIKPGYRLSSLAGNSSSLDEEAAQEHEVVVCFLSKSLAPDSLSRIFWVLAFLFSLALSLCGMVCQFANIPFYLRYYAAITLAFVFALTFLWAFKELQSVRSKVPWSFRYTKDIRSSFLLASLSWFTHQALLWAFIVEKSIGWQDVNDQSLEIVDYFTFRIIMVMPTLFFPFLGWSFARLFLSSSHPETTLHRQDMRFGKTNDEWSH